MTDIKIDPIGIVHSPYKTAEGTPIQPIVAKNNLAQIEIYEEYAEGLKDLELFSHIYVLFHLHKISKQLLKVTPFLDTKPHGVFATRSPGRPNQIGISVVCIEKIEGNIIFIKNIDMLDGSPVLDIKPYIPQFDLFPEATSGWYTKDKAKIENQKDDGRFK